MRILSLFPNLDPAGGGIQSGGVSLVLAGARAGVEHVVACSEHNHGEWSRQLVEQLDAEGVPVVSFPVLGHPQELADRWSVSGAQVPWIWRQVGRFDAVHLHGVWGIGVLTGLAATQAHRVAVVVTAHESLTANDIDKSRSRARRRQKLLLKSIYLRRTDLFVLTSELETHESLPPQAPRHTIPYPLFDARRSLPTGGTKGECRHLTVGYLGRIATKKNLFAIVDALTLLPAHVRLRVAGVSTDDLEDRIRRHAGEQGTEDRIEWLGFVAPSEREQFLQSVDLLAMPSFYESFGMAGAEAMLAGVPLVVSKRTGIAEVITRRGGGLLIDPDAEALAAAVGRLDQDRDLLRRLAAEAREAIRVELDYDAVGHALLAAYGEAVEARARRRRGNPPAGRGS